MFFDRYGIHIGEDFLFIRFYGILIVFGAVLASFLSYRRAKQQGEDPELVWDLMPWVLLCGILGARIWHILTPPPSSISIGMTTSYYLTHPLAALAIWNGGLGILGGVVGGVLAAFFYLRRKGKSFLKWADIIAPGLALAQAIGRWGNFLNQELYGAPTTLPWGIFIEPQFRLPEFVDISYYHPTFFYESVLNIMNMLVLLWVGKRFIPKLMKGDIFLMYLVIYPLIRFFVEFLRLDSSQVGGININQWIMLGIAVISIITLIIRHWRKSDNNL